MAITLATALAVGGAFITRQLATSVRTGLRAEQLEPAAERALVDAIVSWDSVARAQQPIGDTSLLSESASSVPKVNVWITRLTASTYWVVAEAAVDVRPQLRRRIGVVVKDSAGVAGLVSGRAWGDLP
jgi:hypothetical protein